MRVHFPALNMLVSFDLDVWAKKQCFIFHCGLYINPARDLLLGWYYQNVSAQSQLLFTEISQQQYMHETMYTHAILHSIGKKYYILKKCEYIHNNLQKALYFNIACIGWVDILVTPLCRLNSHWQLVEWHSVTTTLGNTFTLVTITELQHNQCYSGKSIPTKILSTLILSRILYGIPLRQKIQVSHDNFIYWSNMYVQWHTQS